MSINESPVGKNTSANMNLVDAFDKKTLQRNHSKKKLVGKNCLEKCLDDGKERGIWNMREFSTLFLLNVNPFQMMWKFFMSTLWMKNI